MNTIGSHPGAIVFRLGIMIILIAIMMAVFFSYLDDTERELERVSVLQTKKIIDSSLVVVFATYAVNNRLGELNDLDGGNPFVFLTRHRAGTTWRIVGRLFINLTSPIQIATLQSFWTIRTMTSRDPSNLVPISSGTYASLELLNCDLALDFALSIKKAHCRGSGLVLL
jgi:hypothetical protein